MLLPAQAVNVPVIPAIGKGLTVIVVKPEFEHPFASEIVTV